MKCRCVLMFFLLHQSKSSAYHHNECTIVRAEKHCYKLLFFFSTKALCKGLQTSGFKAAWTWISAVSVFRVENGASDSKWDALWVKRKKITLHSNGEEEMAAGLGRTTYHWGGGHWGGWIAHQLLWSLVDKIHPESHTSLETSTLLPDLYRNISSLGTVPHC